MAELVFQPIIDGEPQQIRSTVDRAAREVAIHVLSAGDHSQILDLDGEIDNLTEGYQAFGQFMPNLVQLLSLDLNLDDSPASDQISINVHDLDSPTGASSYLTSYDVVSPSIPSFWILEATRVVLEDGVSIDDAKERLRANLKTHVRVAETYQLETVERLENLFGYPERDTRNVLVPPLVAGSNAHEEMSNRATAALESILAALIPQTPKP